MLFCTPCLLYKHPTVPAISVAVSTSSAFPLEGNQYILTCIVSGHESLTPPSVTYQWLRGFSTVQDPSTYNSLIFNPVGPDDSGTYTCRANVNSSLLDSDNITAEGSTTFSVTGKKSYKPILISILSHYQHDQL